ncbi:MAG: DNA cytosine methyltransferase [Candidatus Methanoplasma sp.]|jgi:DNA (cytosine-5)-methyltransferase 1|nr:DNA cytosine methyltransferase [Candidatus Methanoplasma sp.]
MKQYRAIDLFAGIGGIRLGFEQGFRKHGSGVETVFVSEWDEHAKTTYASNFKTPAADLRQGDITKIEEESIPQFDICLAGFPCQAFSIAGQKKGFEDEYKGKCRGTLFFDVARLCDRAEKDKPKVIFCENVKGLEMHDGGRTLEIILGRMREMGYTVHWKVLNSKDYGVPQNRERVYIAAFRNDIDSRAFKFPDPAAEKAALKDILEKDPVSVKYYLSTRYLDTLKKHRARHEAKGNGFGYEIKDPNGVSSAIVCGGMGRERNLVVDDRLSDFTPITNIKGEVNRDGVRKMTPREWARLQGYPDSYKLELADTHLYRQMGNSVTVPVISAIAEKIWEILDASERK